MLFVAAALPAGAAAHTAQKPPNILLITVDTLRADHLSSYGYHLETSPYIDGLAAEGVRFERAYTPIPLTSPAHLALFTGRYPQEIGVRRNGVAPADGVPMLSVPDALGKHGYRRAAFISGWPLTSRLTHLDRWFDHYDQELIRRYQLFNSSRYAEDLNPRAIQWLRGHATARQPFFLWLHYFDPHSPYVFRHYFQPGKKKEVAAAPGGGNDRRTSSRIRDYDSEVYYTDHHIGRILGEIDRLKLRDSTLVVLTADHGESLGEHGYVGHGRHLFESIVRVPLIFRLPGKIAAGKVVRTPVSLVDVAPTLLDLALGGKAAALGRGTALFTGRSLAAALEGPVEPPERRVYFVTFAGKKGSMPSWLSWMWVREKELPLAFGHTDGTVKLVWRPEERALLLNDLAEDPRETKRQRIKGDRYRVETAAMTRWFALTNGPGAAENLSARDKEVLRTLGYAQ